MKFAMLFIIGLFNFLKYGDSCHEISQGASLKEQGMHTFVRWNFIFIAPPLCVTEEEIDEGLEIISNALKIADTYCS